MNIGKKHFPILFFPLADIALFYSIYKYNDQTNVLVPSSFFPTGLDKKFAEVLWNQSLVIGLVSLYLIQIFAYIMLTKENKIAIRHTNFWRALAPFLAILITTSGALNSNYWFLLTLLTIPAYLNISRWIHRT